jgi:SSS family solute:Na+ symporter
MLCSLSRHNRATKQGAFCGILAGVLVVAVTTLMHLSVGQLFPFLPDTAKDVNIGFVALALNIIVFVVVSAVTQPRSSGQSHAQTHVH